jgi:phosphoglycolate phosphatase
MSVLFDLDGTLTDPFEGITKCIVHALVALGRPSPPRESLRWCIGPPLRGCLSKLLGSDDIQLTEQAVRIFRDRFATVGLFENEVYAGIPEALAALQQIGHVLIVATSKPTVYADQILAHFGLRQYFRAAYGSGLDGARSDKSLLVSHILQRESIRSSETVMVGDREHDMLGAAANAVPGIGVLWGYGTREELLSSGASACVAQPNQLVSALKGERDG